MKRLRLKKIAPAALSTVIGLLLAVLGIGSAAAWHFALSSSPHLPGYSMSIGFACCGIAILAGIARLRRLQVITALVATALALLALVSRYTDDPYTLEYLLFANAPDPFIASRPILQPLSATVLLLGGVMLFVAAVRARLRRLPLLLGTAGLLLFGMAVMALFQVIASEDLPNASLGKALMPGWSAVGALLLGIGLTIEAFAQWSKRRPGLEELRESVVLYSTIGALYIALISSSIALLLLHEHLQTSGYERLMRTARSKVQSIELVLWRYKGIARRISGYRDVRRLIQRFEAEAEGERMPSFLREALHFHDEVSGVVRLDVSGTPVAAIGTTVGPDSWPSNAVALDTQAVRGPFMLAGHYFVSVSTPVVDAAGSRTGTDIVIFSSEALQRALAHGSEGSQSTIFLGIGASGKPLEVLTPTPGSGELIKVDLHPYGPIVAALAKGVAKESGFVGRDADRNEAQVAAHLPVAATEMAVAAVLARSALHADIRKEFWLVGGCVLFLALFEVAGMFFLVKAIVSHAERLETQVREKSVLLEEELDERKKIERELTRYKDHLEELVEERTDALNRSQQQLYEAERLASIGILAAGIAHEINNPVGMILCCAQNALNLRNEPDGAEIAQRSLNEIVTNAKRCGKVIKSVLQFSGKEETEKWPYDVNDLVRRALRLMETYTNVGKVRATLDLAPNLPNVPVNPIEIEQMLINIIKNAVEAAGSEAPLYISTAAVAGAVEISITDSGPGLTEEQQKRLFEPFYTTRQNRGGTGLGLSIVHGIVTSHKGAISVDSAPGQGTTFRITLPLGQAAQQPARHSA